MCIHKVVGVATTHTLYSAKPFDVSLGRSHLGRLWSARLHSNSSFLVSVIPVGQFPLFAVVVVVVVVVV